ncbi:zona pellucida sperm-binding protein 3-like [Apus apus]|uniref:zona pellucida sperm-binding protein 3-like n=1 Tax=Apus apus TaxID=8895 RepID=UPI0021F84EE7|nr:zona pellucida sperm-binding protein 3-like [Apus apus]
MGLRWWVLVCGAVLEVAGTTTAPAASASSSHTVVAPVVSSGMGTTGAVAPVLAAASVPGGTPARSHFEEPVMNFTFRLLDGGCWSSGEQAGNLDQGGRAGTALGFQGQGWTLELQGEDPSAVKKPLVVSPGSIIHLEARVDFGSGISLKIYVDQCYGSSSEQQGHSRRVFMVVNSQGCLQGQKLGTVSIQHQRGGSVLQLSIPAPMLEEPQEEQVYVHCLLMAQGHGARSCFYSQATGSWHDTEDPARSTLCHCCATACPPGDTLPTQLPGFPGEGTLRWVTAGPLLVQKEKVPRDEAPCHLEKRFLLAGLVLVGSVLVAAALLGGLLGLALATWRPGRGQRGHRRRQQPPFHAELQSVVRALVPREPELGPDHHSLVQDSA